jgi:hypothetical protein
LTKWQIGKMANWQNGKVTKMANSQNGKIAKWQLDKMAICII